MYEEGDIFTFNGKDEKIAGWFFNYDANRATRQLKKGDTFVFIGYRPTEVQVSDSTMQLRPEAWVSISGTKFRISLERLEKYYKKTGHVEIIKQQAAPKLRFIDKRHQFFLGLFGKN